MSSDAVSFLYVDANGNSGKTIGRIPTATADASVTTNMIPALQGMSHMSLQSWNRTTTTSRSGAGATAVGTGHDFADDRVDLELVFSTTNPVNDVKLSINAPKPPSTLGNDLKIDPTSGDYTAIIAAAIAVMTSREGEAVTGLKQGRILDRRKSKGGG